MGKVAVLMAEGYEEGETLTIVDIAMIILKSQ